MPMLTLPSGYPAWTRPTASSSAVAPWVELTLTRNLADYAFPFCASEADLRACETRILEALEKTGLAQRGQYLPMEDLSAVDQQQLVERRLASDDMASRMGARGVWLREDQGLSIMINGTDHLTVRAIASGHEPDQAWQEINQLDNLLSRLLDFAFDKRRGYLTSVLDNLGTGLRLRALMHLPALRQADGLARHAENAARHGMLVCGVRRAGAKSSAPVPMDIDPAPTTQPPPAWAGEYLYADMDSALFRTGVETLGDLFMICSHATLGRSEPELVFALQHTAAELLAAEETARAQMLSHGRVMVEDRVGRAIGVASRARMMNFDEAYAVLSSLRLGEACHMADTPSLGLLSELLITCQGAHLARSLSGEPSALSLSEARAKSLRNLFGGQ